MFFSLLFTTFAISVGVSVLAVACFHKPVGTILARIVQDPVSEAWRRYVTFAAAVAGISGGVRIYALERYLEPQSKNSNMLELSSERWALEIYRSVIESLQGLAWIYLVFFLVAMVAYVIVKVTETAGKRKA